MDAGEQAITRRIAYLEPYMVIYRDAAMPEEADLSIDPSDRPVGTFGGADPEKANYTIGGQGNVMTAQGFLSTWSTISSEMKLDECIARISVPTLVVGA